MLSEEDRVLIIVLRVEKRYYAKRIMKEFACCGAFCKSESAAAGSVTLTM